MGSLLAWHRELVATLQTVMPTLEGPTDELPTMGGRVVQCAVVWPTPGVETTRADGVAAHARTDTARVVFVGATTLDCLAAVTRGREALQGHRLVASGPGGGRIREAGFQGGEPVVEPGTNPVRVSLSVQFDAVSKEPR